MALKYITHVTVASSLLIHTGCALKDRVDTVETTFLEDVDVSQKRENLPFDHAWVKKGVTKNSYDSVYTHRNVVFRP